MSDITTPARSNGGGQDEPQPRLTRLIRRAVEAVVERPLQPAEADAIERIARAEVAGVPAPEQVIWETAPEVGADFLRALLICEFESEPVGGVRLRGLRVTGALSLASNTVERPLVAESCRFEEPIDLQHADSPQMTFSGCWLRAPLNAAGDPDLSRPALNGEGVRVTGNLVFDWSDIDGTVELARAQITGSVSFEHAAIAGRDTTGSSALTLDAARVDGEVWLATPDPPDTREPSRKFNAAGIVRLVRAEVGGDLYGSGATFGGGLMIERARLGNVYIEGDEPITPLYFSGATIRQLVDEEASWPAQGELYVDGFSYTAFSDTPDLGMPPRATPQDVDARLRWLARQHEFSRQPYEQLARVFREAGDDASARRVLIAREWRRLGGGHSPNRAIRAVHSLSGDRVRKGDAKASRGWLAAVVGAVDGACTRIFGWTLGFGYRPARAVVFLLALWLLGGALLTFTPARDHIVPAKEIPAPKAVSSAGQRVPATTAADPCPTSYPCFSPLAYSWDRVVPVIQLDQNDYWRPDGTTGGQRVRALGYMFTGFGWLLATLGIVGVTGLVRRS